jgi:hypothetical protein
MFMDLPPQEEEVESLTTPTFVGIWLLNSLSTGPPHEEDPVWKLSGQFSGTAVCNYCSHHMTSIADPSNLPIEKFRQAFAFAGNSLKSCDSCNLIGLAYIGIASETRKLMASIMCTHCVAEYNLSYIFGRRKNSRIACDGGGGGGGVEASPLQMKPWLSESAY